MGPGLTGTHDCLDRREPKCSRLRLIKIWSGNMRPRHRTRVREDSNLLALRLAREVAVAFTTDPVKLGLGESSAAGHVKDS